MAELNIPRSKLQGMFCLTAVLRSHRKEFYLIRSLLRFRTPETENPVPLGFFFPTK